MQRYILRRLLLMVPTLLGVSFVVFVIIRSVPGDVVDQVLGEYGAANQEARQQLRKDFGLDQNIALQYVRWLSELVRLDFGHSLLSDRPVTQELKTRLPITFELGGMAILFSLIIAVPIGVTSAVKQDTWADYVGRSLAISLLAAPGFWIGILLITMAGRYFQWGVPPTRYIHFTEDPIGNIRMMWLPSLILGGALSGSVMRFTRSTMLEVLRQDYIRTAWAKGLHNRSIIVRHALRNALIPVVTVVGLQLPVIVGGTVLIEQVYSIPGMGRYYISAVSQKDFPIIQGVNILVACMVVMSNLVVDVTYSVIDPRIRYS